MYLMVNGVVYPMVNGVVYPRVNGVERFELYGQRLGLRRHLHRHCHGGNHYDTWGLLLR